MKLTATLKNIGKGWQKENKNYNLVIVNTIER